MNTTQLIGEIGFIEQPPKKRFRSGQGWTTVRSWTGARSQLDLFLNSGAINFASDLECDEDGEKATVTASFAILSGDSPGNSQINDPISVVWTMPNNDVELPLWEHPKIQKIFLSMGPDAAALLAGFIREQLADNKTLTDFSWDDGGFFDGQTQTELSNFYSRLLRGIETFLFSQYVLRKVQTVIATSAIKAAHANKNKLHSYTLLVRDEPTLPAATLIEPAGLNDQAPPLFWLKRTPQVDEIDRGRWQITQEYWGVEAYDTWTYDTAI